MSTAIILAEVKEGATLQQVCYDMMDLASQVSCNVKFTFEGVEMVISRNMLPEEIEKEWNRRYYGNIPSAMNNRR